MRHLSAMLLVLFLLPACREPDAPAPADRTPDAAAPPLYADLGSHHFPVTTASAEAQAYFDQGIRLTYAFNHDEAIRAFREAGRLDPDCAMCPWGVALALGPNINVPMDPSVGVEAYVASREALALAGTASPVERALIEALATRYEERPGPERAELDRAYARALGEVVERFPENLEAATLYAEALMDLSPWDYWTPEGAPREHTATILAQLERVIAANPNHPGACHFYIHAVEAVQPELAVPCADRLAGLMPGAGHLVHMPAHIYIRVGRWEDAIRANEHAVHADEVYIADQRPGGVYPLAYYPHNYHFLSFAQTMIGRGGAAIASARAVTRNVPVEVAREVPELEGLLPYAHLTLVTFGRWEEVLAEPAPPEDLVFATAMIRYARGVALSALGRGEEAGAALQQVRAAAAAAPEGLPRQLLDLASHALAGEIAARGGELPDAEAHFRQAVAIEDGLGYTEPPYWYYPVRQSLGAVLLEAGRPAEAEGVYREDLARFPENGWSLLGLVRSLEAQARDREAAEVASRLDRVWQGADVTLASSRF